MSRAVIVFAVVGRNEARFLPVSLGQALEAAGPGDRVVYADSDSSDESVAVAGSLGVEVLHTPAGKGNAMSAVLEAIPAELVCFVDGDIEWSATNIPAALAASARDSGADMTIAEFEWPEMRILPNSRAIYRPLAGALFPEAVDACGRVPFSGFRAIRPEAVVPPLPGGFGVETHLNVSFAAAGRSIEVIPVGRYGGPVRHKLREGPEFAAAILDHAERLDRLAPARRPEWDAWVEVVAAEIATLPDAGAPDADQALADYTDRIAAAAARPLPPAR